MNKDYAKRITFASTLNVQRLQAEIDEVLNNIASMLKEPDETAEEWVSYAFVSDESSIGDFLSNNAEVSELCRRLALPDLSRNSLLREVALILHSKKQPQ